MRFHLKFNSCVIFAWDGKKEEEKKGNKEEAAS